MKECDRHPHTVAEARAGRPDAHAAGCERCQDTRLVAGALEHLAVSASRLPAPAADARALLVRSRFVARLAGEQRGAERTARPLAFARVAALAVMAAVMGWALLEGTDVAVLAADPARAGMVYAISRLAFWPLAIGALSAVAAARFLWVED